MHTHREFNPCDRYVFDFDLCAQRKGWAQMDTANDAHYYGAWANPGLLKACYYIEGDVIVKTAAAPAEFVVEIRSFRDSVIEDGRFGIDSGLGEMGDTIKAQFAEFGLADLLH